MTQDELIARQAMRLAELEEKVLDYGSRLRDIRLACICIGGPLNDNVLDYSSKQLGPFRRIVELADVNG